MALLSRVLVTRVACIDDVKIKIKTSTGSETVSRVLNRAGSPGSLSLQPNKSASQVITNSIVFQSSGFYSPDRGPHRIL